MRQDLFKRRATKDSLRAILRDYAFVERCDEYDAGTVDFLLAERTRQGMRDRGEVEAVVQASQLGTGVIMDDRWGRKLAKRADLEHHGTFWVLTRFYDLGFLRSSDLRNHCAALRRRGLRLPWREIDAYLIGIGEQPLVPHEGI